MSAEPKDDTDVKFELWQQCQQQHAPSLQRLVPQMTGPWDLTTKTARDRLAEYCWCDDCGR